MEKVDEIQQVDNRTSSHSLGFNFLIFFRGMLEGGEGRLRFRQLLQAWGIEGEND